MNNNDKTVELRKKLKEIKFNLGLVVMGENWTNPTDYYTNGMLDSDKYTPEMLTMFKNLCCFITKDSNNKNDILVRQCLNYKLDQCYIDNLNCFNKLFNPIPDGLYSYCIRKHNNPDLMSDIETLTKLYEEWKKN